MNDRAAADIHSRRRHPRGVFERPKGSGIWWVRFADQNGHERRQKVGPKQLALKVYQKRKTQVFEDKFFPERIRQRDTLLADAINDYLTQVKGSLRSYATLCIYGAFWKRQLGAKTLRQITQGDIQRTMDLAHPVNSNRRLAFIRRLLNVMLPGEPNPARDVKPFKEQHRIRYLTDEEEAALRTKYPADEWPMVEIALQTGLRLSEQLQLKWEQVDFTGGVIHIPRSKSGETRYVPMNAAVRELLRTLPSRLKGPYVFPSKAGKPRNPRNLMNRVFNPAVERAGITNFTWHCLRHTFASRLAMKGVDIQTIKQLLGHADIKMTMRYSHLSPSHVRAAVELLSSGTSTGTAAAAPAEVREASAQLRPAS